MKKSGAFVTIVLSVLLIGLLSANAEPQSRNNTEKKDVENSQEDLDLIIAENDEEPHSRVRRQSYHREHNPRLVFAPEIRMNFAINHIII